MAGCVTAKSQTANQPPEIESAADPDVAKRAIAAAESSDQAKDLKESEIQYIFRVHERARALADEEYRKNLDQGIDAWYANNKNWRAIPKDLWNNLSERDRGRLKDGVDPEMMSPGSPGCRTQL